MSLVVAAVVLGASGLAHAAKDRPPTTQRTVSKGATAVKHKKRPPARGARHKGRSDAVFPANVERTPGFRYAQLGTEQCYEEVLRRDLPVRRDEKDWVGITAPMRFAGPLRGITFRTDIPIAERSTTPYELFDCRLVLALDDFTELLRAEGIVEVVLSSAYRPPPKASNSDRTQGKRHGGGLAIDIHRFGKADGTWIKVDRDFRGRMGAPVCGKRAPSPPKSVPEAAMLRRLVCGAAERMLFQSILTPNYDYPHRNHFHLELTAGVRWFIVS